MHPAFGGGGAFASSNPGRSKNLHQMLHEKLFSCGGMGMELNGNTMKQLGFNQQNNPKKSPKKSTKPKLLTALDMMHTRFLGCDHHRGLKGEFYHHLLQQFSSQSSLSKISNQQMQCSWNFRETIFQIFKPGIVLTNKCSSPRIWGKLTSLPTSFHCQFVLEVL